MSVCYLEADDEITSAIGRIRGVRDGEVIIVVPAGSRIATSRINFKLLAKEAAARRLNAVAVTDEPAVRALAIAAGLPAYDSIPAAEQALAAFREQDRRLAERLGRPTQPGGQQAMVLPLDGDAARVAPRADRPSETAIMPVDAGADQAAASAGARRRRKRRRTPLAPLAVLALLLLLVGGVAYGAYMFLPTASITLRPSATEIRLEPFTVTADPNVAVVDAAAGVIPAQLVAIPLHVEGTFAATGIEARETRASGAVRFRSENTLNAVPIPAQTVVSTANGIDFVTQDAVTVPRASFETGPSTADVAVRAVRAGTRGNVDANEITRLPQALAAQLITVRNPDPTTGGQRIEETVITQEDYDAAVASLTAQLDATLAAAVADEDNIPRGLVAFPSTAQTGTVQPDQVAADLVDSAAPTFTLALDGDGQVVAVNEELIGQVAETRVAAQLPSGQTLVDDHVDVSFDPGTALGSTVRYEVSAAAQAIDQPTTSEIVAAVRGKTLAEARQALAQYGEGDVTLWPDFIDRVPDQAARISVTLLPVGGDR